MDVIGFNSLGRIVVVINGEERSVPDDMENSDRQRVATWEAEGNTIPAYATPLVEVKSALKASIDAAAEAERLKYITGGAGQAMTYQQKSDEAKRYLAAIDAGVQTEPSAYPLLSAEVGITAATLEEVAAIVNGAYQQWQIIGAAIEAVRLGTKTTIDAAPTVADAEGAARAAVWP